jgi:signal transduction histidine kinase
LEALTRREITVLHPHVLGENEGILVSECTQGSCPNCFIATNGSLYFSTVKGVVRIDPPAQRAADPLPSAAMEEVSFNGTAVWDICEVRNSVQSPVGDHLRLPPGPRDLEFHYTAFSPNAPEQIKFRYRLDGLDERWTEAGTRRTAYYPHITPGRYRLQVSACNREGKWSPIVESPELDLLPHFYETGWFLAAGFGLVAAGLIFTGRGISHFRLRRRLGLLEMQNAVANERARIAKDIHDDVGARVTEIILLGEMVKSPDNSSVANADQVGSILQKVRQLHVKLSEAVWAINPRNDSLSNLVEFLCDDAQRFLEHASVNLQLDVDSELPSIQMPALVRHNVALATKEAVNNVVRHAAASKINLCIKVENGHLCITVADDGCGFEVSSQAAGNGLGNMQARLVAVGGSAGINSRPDGGTTVTFTLPLNSPTVAVGRKIGLYSKLILADRKPKT